MGPRPRDWSQYIVLGIGVMVSVFAAFVLAAWSIHFLPLIRPAPGLPPVTRQGAAAQFLLGAGMACLALGRRRAATVCASLAIILAVLVGVEYVWNLNLGVDQLLGRDYIDQLPSPPGRFSPLSALSYFAAATALLALSIPKASAFAPALAGISASILIAIGAVMSLGYVLGESAVYRWGRFRNISAQTAVVLAFLGTGIFLLALEESRRRKTLPKWLPMALALGLSVGALGMWQALIAHEESDFPVLSHVVLACGILGALLIAIAVSQTQKARLRSRQLQERKEAFERWFEASPDALLVIDGAGRIANANERTARIFGCTRGEILGSSIESLLPINLQELHTVHRKTYSPLVGERVMGQGKAPKGRRQDGSEFPVEVYLSPLQTSRGPQVLATVRDITERHQAEEALRQSEERFRNVFEKSPLGLALIGPDYRLLKVNASLCRMSGYCESELVGMNPLDITHPEDRDNSLDLAERLFKGEIPSYHVEKRYVKKNGGIIWATMSATVMRDSQGNPLYGLGMVEDITERKQAQEALRQSEERFRSLIEQGPIGITLIDNNFRFLKVNSALCRMLGYSESELMGMTPLDFTHPDDRQPTIELTDRLFATETPMRKLEKRYVRKNGEIIWGSVTASVIHDQQGKALYAMGMIEDITERKRAEEEMRTLSQRLSQAIRFASMSVWQWDPPTNSFIWDDAAFEMAGIPKTIPLPYQEWTRLMHPEDRPAAEAALLRVFKERTQESMEFRVIRPDGELRHVYAAGGPILDQHGKVARVVGIVVDITERKHAENELRILTQRLALATRSASMGVFEFNVASQSAIWDDMMFQIFGITKRPRVERQDWRELLHPDDLSKADQYVETIVRTKKQHTVEFRIIRPEGSLRHVSASAGPVMDENRNVTDLVGIVVDITERKQLEQDLEEARGQAITSARLSALGMMAGGVAHEINNPLSIIHAMASDLVEQVTDQGAVPPQMVSRKALVIRETAQRIARIVKSLRHISREGRSDPFRPTPLAKIVAETLEICREKFKAHGVELLLPRTIPELSVACREVQIAQALLNLLQNAFDAALEQDGERWVKLEVELREASVALSVVDSGPGIPSEIRSRVMEPFFTTKPVGKGTGLGLSLSKTIAEDHGGRLEYSEDRGHTRFALVLPLVRKAEAA